MGGCLKACCVSEAGLRCHSVLTLCGFGYFIFMFSIFNRQIHYFEFEVPDPQGTKWACLFTALLFLLWFIVAITKIIKIEENEKAGPRKNKISLAEIKQMKEPFKQASKYGEDKQESEKLLAEE